MRLVWHPHNTDLDSASIVTAFGWLTAFEISRAQRVVTTQALPDSRLHDQRRRLRHLVTRWVVYFALVALEQQAGPDTEFSSASLTRVFRQPQNLSEGELLCNFASYNWLSSRTHLHMTLA